LCEIGVRGVNRQGPFAQIIFAGRDLGNRIICAQQRGMLTTHAAGQIGAIFQNKSSPTVRPKRARRV
jgi:hypothetical protein